MAMPTCKLLLLLQGPALARRWKRREQGATEGGPEEEGEGQEDASARWKAALGRSAGGGGLVVGAFSLSRLWGAQESSPKGAIGGGQVDGRPRARFLSFLASLARARAQSNDQPQSVMEIRGKDGPSCPIRLSFTCFRVGRWSSGAGAKVNPSRSRRTSSFGTRARGRLSRTFPSRSTVPH